MHICPKESDEQIALLQWATLLSTQMPPLRLLFAIANGGYRNIVTATKLKAEGVKPGVPDLCLPVPRKGHHALYIEMKRGKGGQVSNNQKQWKKDLEEQGNRVVICHGFEQARDALLDYLN